MQRQQQPTASAPSRASAAPRTVVATPLLAAVHKQRAATHLRVAVPASAAVPSSTAKGAAASNGAQHAAPSSTSGAVKPAQAFSATLLLQCADQKGVIAAVSQLLYGLNCNIVSSDQYSDVDANMFFQRIDFDYSDIVVGAGNTPILERALTELANRFNMTWKISYKNKVRYLGLRE